MSSEAIGDLLISVTRRWRSSSALRQRTITREQYWVLRTLSEGGPFKVNELAASIGCTPSSASISVKRLEKSGLVTRTRNEKDERVVRVAVTGKGRKTLDDWRRQQKEVVSSIFERLSQKEKHEFFDLLSKAAGTSDWPHRTDGGEKE